MGWPLRASCIVPYRPQRQEGEGICSRSQLGSASLLKTRPPKGFLTEPVPTPSHTEWMASKAKDEELRVDIGRETGVSFRRVEMEVPVGCPG